MCGVCVFVLVMSGECWYECVIDWIWTVYLIKMIIVYDIIIMIITEIITPAVFHIQLYLVFKELTFTHC